jgi:hypothetical protein
VTKLFSLTSSPPCSHPPLLLEHLASPPISLRPSWGKQRRRWSTSSSGGTRRSSSSAAPPLPLWILQRGDTWRGPHGQAAQRGEAAARRDDGTTRQGGSATRGRCGEGAPPLLQPGAAPPSRTGNADLRVLELQRRCWLGGRAARRCGGSACTTSSYSPRQKVRSTHGPPGRRGAVATSPSSDARPACS